MSSKELDNIIYFSYVENDNFEDNFLYKINIYNLSKELFKLIFVGNSDSDIKFLSSDLFCKEIKIYDLISVRDFVWFEYEDMQFSIKSHYVNFSLFTEHDILELIKLFEICNVINERFEKKDICDDNTELLNNLKQNYKKYINEAIIKSII